MSECLVSVIIINWNRKQLLYHCLKSLKNQTYKNHEIIVVDNGSTDGSVDFIRSYFKDIKLIVFPENRGFASGNNAGLKLAQGSFVALINNDVEAHEKWLEELCNALQHNPEVGFVSSKILFFEKKDTIDAVGNMFSVVGIGEKRGWMDKDCERFNKPAKIFGACAGAAMYRRKMLEELGGFDEDFSPAYYEDIDLDFRAQLKGYQCLYIPTALVYHRVTSTIGLYSPEHIYLCNRNLTYVIIKNIPTELLLKYLPKMLIYLIVSVLYHYLKCRGNAYFFGRVTALKKLPAMLKKRKAIQNSRVVSNKYIDSILIKGRLVRDGKIFLKKRLSLIKLLKNNEARIN